jgi:hypothetical protein
MAGTKQTDQTAAAAGQRAETGGQARTQRPRRLQTLAERVRARASKITHTPVGSRWPDDADPGPRSFRVLGANLQRLQAAVHGSQARAYGTEFALRVPATLDEAVNEAIVALCTHYEDLLNEGQEFPRENVRLSTGPRPGRPRRQPDIQMEPAGH